MTNNTTSVHVGGGLFTLCFLASLVLFILKCVGVVMVSWWIVFTPLLAWLALLTVGAIVTFIIFVIMFAVTDSNKKKALKARGRTRF